MSTLPKAPEPIIIDLLIRAKAFLDHALMHAQSNSPIDMMIAVHNLDNCVEYLLRIINRHLETESFIDKSFDTRELPHLAKELDRYLKENHNMVFPL